MAKTPHLKTGNRIPRCELYITLNNIDKLYETAIASSHSLRKTFGKHIYEADARSERALVYLSEIFSHSSISTIRKYIGITQEAIADMYMSL